MRVLYYTADIDRDANFRVPGRRAAASADRGSGTEPRFSSSEEGLGTILDILDGLGIRGTLFFEGKTAEILDCSRAAGHCIGIHGYEHEDFAELDDGGLEEVLEKSYASVNDAVGKPVCFRAPYLSCDGRTLRAVRETTGITADSSYYTEPGGSAEPYEKDGCTVYPVPKIRDPGGKTMAAYLWPMHEGKRSPAEYAAMAEAVDGPLVLADHSWHMAETLGGKMSAEEARKQREAVTEVLETILDSGYSASVLVGRRGPSPDAHV